MNELKITESLRNVIESNILASKMYDLACQNRFYESFVFEKIRARIESIKRERRYGIMIEVSSLCNANCIFCPNAKLNRNKGIMSDYIFNTIVSRIKEDGINPYTVDLFDIGEPLLDKGLFEKVGIIRSEFPFANIRILTNFGLADDNVIVEIVNSGIDCVHISLNASNKESHKKIMKIGSYEKIIDSIHKLLYLRDKQGKGPRVFVSMVLCDENKEDERLFLAQWQGKVDSVILQRAINWGGKVDIVSKYNRNKMLYPCNDLFERIVILSSGDVALCCQDAEGIIGKSVLDQGLLDIFYSEDFERIREKHLAKRVREVGMCVNCFGVNSNGANWLFNKYI